MIGRLREVVRDFTADRVLEQIGVEAHRALGRNETTPAERATRDGSSLSTLIRLFSLQRPVERAAAQAALAGLVDELVHHGLLAVSGDEVRALADVRPYGDENHDWWVICDLTPGLDGAPYVLNADHVLGISEASSTLAQLTVRRPVERALDLGTGCGVQALHLAEHVADVVATDVNARALKFARWTAELNGIDVDVRDGSLYEPVADQRFDLIVTNPPFVISPPGSFKLTYRDSGLVGDEMVRRVVSGAAAHLATGGVCHVLANWIHERGVPWEERLAAWTAGTGMDVWAVQREVADPAAYAEMWLADAGLRTTPEYVERYDEWLAWFAGQRIDGVGFGWITLRRTEHDRPHQRFEEWTGPLAQPLGATHERWLAVVDERLRGAEVSELVLRRAADVAEHAVGVPGAADPSRITLRQESGMLRAQDVDTVVAGLVGACDGELSVGQILDALAELLELDPLTVRRDYEPLVGALLDQLFLL